MKEMRQQIKSMRTVHNESTQHYISEEVKKELSSQNPLRRLLTLGSDQGRLKINGDLRLRYERRERQGTSDKDIRDRFRQRFRLGFTWSNLNNDWLVAVGFSSGDESSTTANDTYSDKAVFESGDLRLDYAYAKHSINEKLSLILGQQKNPFLSSALFWDGDIRPVGVTLAYQEAMFFGCLGAYDVAHVGTDENDAMLYALQSGIKTKSYTAALAYYHFNDALTSPASTGLSGLPNSLAENYNFHILSFYNSLNFEISAVKAKIYAEISRNFGARGKRGEGQGGNDVEPDKADLAWAIGGSLSYRNFTFKYNYGYIEADSLYAGIKDSDFVTSTSGTGVQGQKISLEYQISRNLILGSTLYLINALDDSSELRQLELDVIYKF